MLSLVTGASSGIGLQYATQLARDYHSHILLVSNQEQELKQVADEIAQHYGVRTIAHYADLSQPDAAEQLFAYCKDNNLQVDVLINNAGVFFFNPYINTPMKRIELMMQLHVITVAKLCRLFAEDMAARQQTLAQREGEAAKRLKFKGYILNMSSMSSWMAMPGIQTYNATKAFIYNFSKSIWYELRPQGVSVTVMAPGLVCTPLVGLPPKLLKLAEHLTVGITPERLVKRALRKLFKGKKADTPGFLNWLSTPLLRHTPDWLLFFAQKKLARFMK